MTDEIDALVEDLAEHLQSVWPHVLNDDFKYEVAREAITFLNDQETAP